MKRLLIVLAISSMFSEWSCSVSKHIDKSAEKETKLESVDSISVKKEIANINDIKTDSSTITTVEQITTVFKQPEPGDTSKTRIPLSQTINRKIIEKKAIREQKNITGTKLESTAKKKNTSDKKEADNEKKDIEKQPFKLPWWTWLIGLGLLIGAGLYTYNRIKGK